MASTIGPEPSSSRRSDAAVDRRDFLRIAALGGTAAGAAAVLAACSSGGAPPLGGRLPSAASAAPSAAALRGARGAAVGRCRAGGPIKIGYVSPQTGRWPPSGRPTTTSSTASRRPLKDGIRSAA